MIEILFAIMQAAFILALAPLITGLIRKLKATMQSRRGPPIWQPYYDLAKLFRKNSVASKDASWVSAIAPYVCMAAMDAGSTFGGMGSSREMMISSIIEPAILLAIFTTALLTGTTNLGLISKELATSGADFVRPSLFLAFAAFFIATLAENARLPFDNPTTHLELAMVHEGMLLEYSGKQLALMEWSSMTKLLLFMAIGWNAFLPWGIATSVEAGAIAIGILVFIAKVLLLVIAIALIESSIAKLRLFRLPNLLTVSFMLAFLAVLSFYIL